MFHYIIILIIIIICFIYSYKRIDSFNVNIKTNKIAILIISISDPSSSFYDIYQIQKKIWKKYYRKDPKIDCFFIECGKQDRLGANKIVVNCRESYRPGIFQKTILSLQHLQDQYDYFIRTNLNSFFIFPYLHKLLAKIHTNDSKVIYTGDYSDRSSWICGNSIILNKLAVKLLVTEGLKSKYFDNQEIFDDVLIGNLFSDKGIKPFKLNEVVFWIDQIITPKQLNKKLKQIDKSTIPIIRTRPKYNNLKYYSKLLDKLLVKYYN